MSDATLAMAAIALKLTAIASVRTGRTALETTSATLPCITLWSTSDKSASEQGYGVTPQFTRSVVIEAQVLATAQYPDDFDTLLSSVRCALNPYPPTDIGLSEYITDLRLGAVQFFAPADNSNIAIMQVMLEFDYLERF